MRDVALRYINQGWSVIPVKRDKRPLFEWRAYQKRRATGEEIKMWWKRWPDANVGVIAGAISNLVVLDVDGPEGEKTLRDHKLNIPPTATSRTGGGFHYFFKHPGFDCRNFAGKAGKTILPGLDFRGDGGFVVVPPSIHQNGNPYKWIISPEDGLQEAPEWLLKLIREQNQGEGRRLERSDWVVTIEKGRRNETLTRLAGSLLKKMDPPEALTCLKALNKEKCRPPLSDGEVERIVESIASRESGKKPLEQQSKAELLNLAGLLNAVQAHYKKYVVFQTESQSATVTLWTLSTYIFDQFDQSPYLNITSPEKRCGKSRLLDVAELLVARPWRVVTPTESVLFRKIDLKRPTLLFDEIDALLKDRKGDFEGTRALLNAGNRVGTTVPRCVGAKFELRDFNVYCPKSFAGIGDKLPSTVKDRSITVKLARKRPDETVMRFRQKAATQAAKPLGGRLERWAESADLSEARPEIPGELDDRAQDCWEPLLAIADSAGGAWPERARRAALELSAGRFDQDDSFGSKMLQDAQGVFDEKKTDRLSSEELIQSLIELEEAPWRDYYGKPITARSVARLLKPYGIEPKTQRFGEETVRGYLRADFTDAWARYLPPKVLKPSENTLKTQQAKHSSSEVYFKNPYPQHTRSEGEFKEPPSTSDVADREFNNLPSTSDVADVADKEAISKGRGKKDPRFRCSNCGKKAGTVEAPLFDRPVGDGDKICRGCWDELERQRLEQLR